jgi:hypothetical protein
MSPPDGRTQLKRQWLVIVVTSQDAADDYGIGSTYAAIVPTEKKTIAR